MNKYVIYFDGVCNFCNASVRFVINRDPKSKFGFCSLQSEEAAKQLKPYGIKPSELQTIILLKNGKTFFKSRAALEIARELSGLWPALFVFVIVPPFIRDFLYSIIAKNRYKWFGRLDECVIPTGELLNRFVC